MSGTGFAAGRTVCWLLRASLWLVPVLERKCPRLCSGPDPPRACGHLGALREVGRTDMTQPPGPSRPLRVMVPCFCEPVFQLATSLPGLPMEDIPHVPPRSQTCPAFISFYFSSHKASQSSETRTHPTALDSSLFSQLLRHCPTNSAEHQRQDCHPPGIGLLCPEMLFVGVY